MKIKQLLFLSLAGAAAVLPAELCGYSRIISLGSIITENIYAIGSQDMLIANTIYCTRPEAAKDKKKIGDIMNFDIERIIALKPDIILATPLTNKNLLEKASNMGLEVKLFEQIKDFEQFCLFFIELGAITGKKDFAVQTVAKLKEEVAKIAKASSAFKKTSVFIQIGSKPLFAATKEYLINDMVNFAGGFNIAAEAGIGFYSREKVVSAGPEVILIVDMGVPAEHEKALWQSYKNLNAVRNNKIYIVDSYKYCGPTPATFLQAIKELSGYLHNEK